MNIHYLEIVSADMDREIELLEATLELNFGDPVEALGRARVAAAPGGGTIGVRAPMHDAEATVARPYFLTDALDEKVAALSSLGAQIALPRMEIEGHGVIAIYIVNGIEYGLWQV